MSDDTRSRTMNCPDCDGVVSKRAVSCPHCGAPIAAAGDAASIDTTEGQTSVASILNNVLGAVSQSPALYNRDGDKVARVQIDREFFRVTDSSERIESVAIRNISAYAVDTEKWDREDLKMKLTLLYLIGLLIFCFGHVRHASSDWVSWWEYTMFSAMYIAGVYLYGKTRRDYYFDKIWLVLETNAGTVRAVWAKKHGPIDEIVGSLEKAMAQHG